MTPLIRVAAPAALLLLAAVAGPVRAQVHAPAAITQEAPCCTIVAIDAAAGVLTIRDGRSRQTYTVEVPPSATGQLKVGQAVYGRASATVPHFNRLGRMVAAASGGSGTTKIDKQACDLCRIRCIHMTDTLFGWRSDGHGGRIWSDAALSWYDACTKTRCTCRT